jgi:hypothetical protein
MKPDEPASRAFLIRVWRERRDVPNGDPVWRGSIDDVDGGPRVYFGSLPEMVDYVRSRAGIAKPAARRGWCRERVRRRA